MARQLSDVFSSDPMVRLTAMRSLNQTEQDRLINGLCHDSPIQPWPYGMRTTVAPICVILGASPGNSRRPEDVDGDTLGRSGVPPCCGTVPAGFDYEDMKQYWKKASDLCSFVLMRYPSIKSSEDALALSGHLNLGTGQNGTAGVGATDPKIIEWVSSLIYQRLHAKILIVWGLNGIFKDTGVAAHWNHDCGLRVDWSHPNDVMPFGRYHFRFWKAKRSDDQEMAVVMWPNNPSRPPFAGGPDNAYWAAAKNTLDHLLMSHGF